MILLSDSVPDLKNIFVLYDFYCSWEAAGINSLTPITYKILEKYRFLNMIQKYLRKQFPDDSDECTKLFSSKGEYLLRLFIKNNVVSVVYYYLANFFFFLFFFCLQDGRNVMSGRERC